MVKPIFTGEAEVEVARRYAAGESMYKLANDYGCGYQAVKRAVVNHGVTIRKSPKAQKLTPEQREAAVALYVNSDLSLGDAAKQFGISGATLAGMVTRRGYRTRSYNQRGPEHHGWKGGRSLDKRSGYMRVRVRADDPEWLRESSSTNGDMLEHRYVMAKHLGRPLMSEESVHHMNGDKTDNRIENLQMRNGKHGKGVALVCTCCGSTDIKEVMLE